MDDKPEDDCGKATSTAPPEVANKTASIEVVKSDSTGSIPEVVVRYDSDELFKESTVCYHFSSKKRKRARRLACHALNAKQKENTTNNVSPPLKKDVTMKNSIAVQSPP
jgi:hypothetical protein